MTWTDIPSRLITSYASWFGGSPDFFVRAPGRVDLVGAHTDYNEGPVLPAAVNMHSWVAARPAEGKRVTIHACDMAETVTIDLRNLDARIDADDRPLPNWAMYVAGVAWSMREAGIRPGGAEMAIASDVLIGAGLSSSAAVEVGYGLAFAEMAGAELDRMELAQICRRAENDYVGVASGLMDQFSSLFGQRGHALYFDTRSLEWEALRLSSDVALVLADTGTRRELTGGQLNQRRQECEMATAALKTVLPDIQSLRDVTPEALAEHHDAVPKPAVNRARHVVEEIVRVTKARSVLKRGDMVRFGELMDESHMSSRDWYESSSPALDAMWRASHAHPARLGGRFLGAGFAGTLIFLAHADGAQEFGEHTIRRFAEETGETGEFRVVRAEQGAEVLSTNV